MSLSLPNASLRPTDLSGLKVLVVDDHVNVQRLICDVLRAAGVRQIETAFDGAEARQKLAACNPDIIFCDWIMPGMDGLQLTRLIRRAAITGESAIPNPAVPVIVVTGRRSVADVDMARLAGVNEFVVKPFTPASLLSRIQLVLLKPREFVISEVYVGPDRRRRPQMDYVGPLRRASDPQEMIDEDERAATRETMSVELNVLHSLVESRGGVDRETLKMVHRVLQHTCFRAGQVRDLNVRRAAGLLLEYVDAMGGHKHCDAELLNMQLRTIGELLLGAAGTISDPEAAVAELERDVRQRIAARLAA